MAELKHTFVKGRMNKDLDERLIPNGEYRDALNVQVSNSEGSDVGALENTLGNTQVSSLGLTNAVAIGAADDKLNKKIYWFITSDEVDGIYEYNTTTKQISPIVVDPKTSSTKTINSLVLRSNIDNHLVIDNLSVQEAKDLFNISDEDFPTTLTDEVLIGNNVIATVNTPEISISIPRNTVMMLDQDSGYVFKNISYSNVDFGDLTVVFNYSDSSVLGFDKKHLITGSNVLNGTLYFTDDLNEPRAVNIDNFRRYSASLVSDNGEIATDTQTQVAGEIYVDENIKESFQRDFVEKDINVAKSSPQASPTMHLKDSLRDGVVEAIVEKNLYTDGVLVRPDNVDPSFSITYGALPDWRVGDKIRMEPSDLDIDGNDETDEWEAVAIIREIATASNKITFDILSYTDDPDDKTYLLEQELMQDKSIYELKFPRFAYRWKYNDNTYSTFSPFTEPAFLPGKFEYDGKNAYNEGVVNRVKKITLSNIDLGDDTVKELDILMKDDNDNNVYVISNQKKSEFFGTLEITKEQINSVVPNQQLLRQWDNVPKRAKAQEVVANRLLYGNYVQNYNVYSKPEFDININQKTDDTLTSIKSDRSYEFGVVYVDKYNRQTPVIAGKNNVITVPKDNSVNTNQFKVKLNNSAPAWATHFKYFIKETSNEYYNLAANRFYLDLENGFAYVSFPSADRNKITEDNYLLLKKNHGDNSAVLEEDNRYKVIEIFNEAPEFISSRKRVIHSLGDIVFTKNYNDSLTIITNKEDDGADNSIPLVGYAAIQLQEANGGGDVPIEDAAKFQPGKYLQFEYDGKVSDAYKIKRLSQHPAGDNEIKIEVDRPFEQDVEIIYDADGNVGDGIGNRPKGVIIHALEEYSAKGDKEFDGKFFVKLRLNNTLEESIIKQDIGGKEYLTKEAVNLIGVYSRREDGKRNNNGFDNSARGRDNAHKSAVNPFVVSHGGGGSGENLKLGGLEYHLSLEGATHKLDGKVTELSRVAKVGNFVRFVNKDGTPHHDTVYEIGATLNQKFDARYGSSSKKNYRRLSFKFVDDQGEPKPLEVKVCNRGEDTWDNEVRMEILQERTSENTFIKDPAIFETEPLESKTDLDIYYETEKAYNVSEHGNVQTLKWFNCFSFGNGVESNRIRDDYNAPFIKNGVRASTVLEDGYNEERVFNGVIWSGIVNPNSAVNNSNQFIQAEPITKSFLPSYGNIQKLHAWDDSLVVLTENKILRTPANKSALYNADGSTNLISTNRVIGDPIEYNGDFGISNDPQSFASFGFRCYFVDRKNGKVIRLSKDGLTAISAVNMNDFFRDRLATSQTLFGSYDERNKLYNLSFTDDNDTVCFSEGVNGWPTRKSFVPQCAISLNSIYYTFYNGDLWEHDSISVNRNNFYGNDYYSEVKLEINDDPSTIKKFKTLAYEGTKDWTADVVTDQEKSSTITFKDKENKYFANLSGEVKEYNSTSDNLDLKKFNFQGIGKPSAMDTIEDNRPNTLLKFTAEVEGLSNITSTTHTFNKKPGDRIYTQTVTIFLTPPSGFTLVASDFKQITKDGYTSKINGSISQRGAGIAIEYTHGVLSQPDANETIIILLSGKMVQNDVTVSGSHKHKIVGVTSNFIYSREEEDYAVTGKPNTEKTILTRIFTASKGYELYAKDIKCSNPAVRLVITEIVKGYSYKVTEKTVIPSVTEINRDYEISAIATAVEVAKKKIISRAISTSNLGYENDETRILKVIGEPGAILKYKFADTSNTIEEKSVTIPDSGKLDIAFNFPAGTTAETYTISFAVGTDTEFSDSWQGSVTIKRIVKAKKTINIIASLGNYAKHYQITVDAGTQLIQKVDIPITAAAADYKVLAYPKASDFVIKDEDENNVIVFDGISLIASTPSGGSNKNLITLNFNIAINSVDHNDNVYIDLTKLVGKDIDLTIAYNATTTGGTDTAAGSAYTISPTTSHVINGVAGTTPGDVESIYSYVLTIASGKELIPTIVAGDFVLYDSSNNDVTSTYNEDGTLDLRVAGNKVYVDFKPKNFTMPTSDTTLTIRPTKAIVQTTVASVDYSVMFRNPNRVLSTDSFLKKGSTYGTGTWRVFEPIVAGRITDTSGTKLIQVQYKINRRLQDDQQFTKWSGSDNSITFEGGSDTELSLATAGTYTPYYGGDDVTVTGGFEVEESAAGATSTLTVNLLLDCSAIPAGKQLGVVTVNAGVSLQQDVKNKATFGAINKETACALTDSYEYGFWNLDFTQKEPKVGAWVVSQYVSGSQIGGDLPIAYGYPYIKDNILGKIYHINVNTGRIQEILDLCAEEPDATLVQDAAFNIGSTLPFEREWNKLNLLPKETSGYSNMTRGWEVYNPVKLANYKELMNNNGVAAYGVLENVKFNMILKGLTEDALDKYQGSILAASSYDATNRFLFDSKNLDSTYIKTYNGNNSSINMTFVLKVANGSSQGSVNYIVQHVFSSMPAYPGGSYFGYVTLNNGDRPSFNYGITLDMQTRFNVLR